MEEVVDPCPYVNNTRQKKNNVVKKYFECLIM